MATAGAAAERPACLGTFQLDTPVLACAFSRDGRYLALSTPDDNDITVFTVPPPTTSTSSPDSPQLPHPTQPKPSTQLQWHRAAVLRGHDDPVTSLDWSHPCNLLLSCSEDRNAFIFTPPPTPTNSTAPWQRQPVSCRLSRAALCAAWAPGAAKFALGSADHSISVGFFSQQAACYTTKLIRSAHQGPVVALAWHPHPTTTLLASSSTDGTCRVYSAFIAGVDAPRDAGPSGRFGQLLLSFHPHNGWVHSVCWTPGGADLLLLTHGGSRGGGGLHCVTAAASLAAAAAAAGAHAKQGPVDEGVKEQAPHRSVVHKGLPLKLLLALSDTLVLAAGWDGALHMYQRAAAGPWELQQHSPLGQDQAMDGTQGLEQSLSLDALSLDQESAAARAARAKPLLPSTKQGVRPQHHACVVGLCSLPPPDASDLTQPAHDQQGEEGQPRLAVRVASVCVEGEIALWGLD